MEPYQQGYSQPFQPQSVNVSIQQPRSPSFLIRALYFICVGWWLGFIWLQLGFLLCALVVTLPLGLVMLNRVPQVLTLRSQGGSQTVHVATTVNGTYVNVSTAQPRQTSFLIRAIYFVFIGSWVGWLWANIGYGLCVIIITMPIGLVMLNRLPAVLTLRKN